MGDTRATAADAAAGSVPCSGLLAALMALGVAELVAAFVDAEASPVVAVGGSVIDATPQWLKEWAIEQFGTNDKPVLIGSIVAVLLLLVAGDRRARGAPPGHRPRRCRRTRKWWARSPP